MRNNSGALPDRTGRVVRYGLGNVSKTYTDKVKSSDLIGITKVVITPSMVGKTLGVFTAVEVKKEDWDEGKKFDTREIAQNNFINWVKSLDILDFKNLDICLPLVSLRKVLVKLKLDPSICISFFSFLIMLR